MDHTRSAPRDIEKQLMQVEPLLVRMVRHRTRGWPSAVFDELCQQVRVRLWQRVLPQYDPGRGALEPFAARAIGNIVTDELRRLRTRRTEFAVLPDELSTTDPDPFADGQAELLHSTRRLLKQGEVELLDALLDDREPRGKRTAKSLIERKSKLKARLTSLFRSRLAA